jgi:hypothetical protein
VWRLAANKTPEKPVRFVTPEERRVLPRPASLRHNKGKIAARKAAIEKELAAYVHLKCGHLTTREEIDFFSVWQAKPRHYYCTKCGKWIDEDKKARNLPAIELDELPF